MIKTISSTPQTDGSVIVQRIKEGVLETLKETTEDTGEIMSEESEMLTIQTITITRRIGEKITF
jgi:hypothetical protein